MENKISEIINETIEDLGFELVKILIRGSERKVIEILIDRKDDRKVEVVDCKKVSRTISALMDVEDIISNKYFLEVSSAGVERPLVKFDDYKRFHGRDIKLSLKSPHDEQFNFRGKITDAEEGVIVITHEDKSYKFNFDNIKKANLSFTDDLFKKLLNKK